MQLLTISQLKAQGLITQTPQLVHGVGWSYLPLRPDWRGGNSFKSPGYSEQELEDPKIQQMLFSQYMEETDG